jgi:hypothetical protein
MAKHPKRNWDEHAMTRAQPEELSGVEYLAVTAKAEENCARLTTRKLNVLGVRARTCVERLGTTLDVLSGAAGCRWGCRKGDHLVERLLGRGTATAHASYRLLMNGFYDESLALSRSVAELGNLLALFSHDADSFARWKTATRRDRMSAFTPVRVRLRLEELHLPVPVNEERYAALCEIGVHVTPETTPNTHNPEGIPAMGGLFQPVGFLMGLNQLAWSVCCVVICGASLLADNAVAVRLTLAGTELSKAIGPLDIVNREQVMDSIRTMVNETPDPS